MTYTPSHIMCFAFALFCQTNILAQKRFYNSSFEENNCIVEVSAGAGTINCLTDLGGRKGPGKKFLKDINWDNSQASGNFSFGVIIKDVFAARLEASFGTIKAYDSILVNHKNDARTMGRYFRNLNFRSRIQEFSLQVEFHPIMLFDADDMPRLSPYVGAGIGRFSFDPETYYNGRWIRLQPLKTEGQGFAEYPGRQPYKLQAFSYPLSIGLRYEVSNMFAARFEISHRFTSTDHLDDVSNEVYINPDLFAKYLKPGESAMAEKLYNRYRGAEFGYQQSYGDIRGQSFNKDGFFTICLKAGLTLGRLLRQH